MFSFVEVDLKEQLSAETLELHKAGLQEREKYRLAQKQKEQELEELMPQKFDFRQAEDKKITNTKMIARR